MTAQRRTINEALRWASLFLQQRDREPRVAEILLQYHTGLERAGFLAAQRELLPKETDDQFIADVKAHGETGIPVQHLTGTEAFYGRDFLVDKHVLIPRPETEELVLGVLEYARGLGEKPVRLVDVGTGSGVIAITLKLEKPSWKVAATDISEHALQVAKQNADRLGAEIDFQQGYFLQPVVERREQVDIIVSNPPYIAHQEKASLDETVKNFDPALALFAEKEGLAAYHQIIDRADSILASPGLIAFEIGHQQGVQVSGLIRSKFPGASIDIRKDINGKDRMVFAQISKKQP
ncbi:peptide chain release factor N(5)-glutamine methyltransferase [Sediminibacillus dalangtanensis]|uniref:Release factor glutamine methyltransferase n=1 Tax=Sediminibacillus dalangtanensis TaxID=2729421 RepID=A0ABX7VYT4_9BACI|nr:peptide chain release factor N(5)-glutamine methyltransferase [Sediminibacillus dalangtanensis]QTN00876.1 peptide chain release factor N(5)-glutamine methyltransferase [Sediminibacillus dalangtanensis]